MSLRPESDTSFPSAYLEIQINLIKRCSMHTHWQNSKLRNNTGRQRCSKKESQGTVQADKDAIKAKSEGIPEC